VISTSTVFVAYDAYGNTPMTLNKLLVTGTNAILDMGGTNIVVATGYAGAGGGSSNSFEINGGLVTNVGAVSIASTWYNEVFKYSRLLITNGGRLYSSQASTIVPTGNSYNNTVEVYGSNSVWMLGGGNLAIGTATGGTNNTLTIDQGGTVDAVGTLTVATTNRVFLKSGLLGALAMADNSLSLFTVGTGASSATLKALGGTLLFNSGLTINTNATLTGVGTVSGGSVGVTLTDGAILSPGLASAGTVTIGGSNLTWAGGGIYSCEITNLTLGFGVGWDVVNVSSQLVFTGTTPKFIKMDSKGVASGFNPALNYTLKILTYGGITGYDTNLITLDTSAFSTVPASTWYLTNVNNALWLVSDGLNPNGDANLVWKVPSNGVWSGAGNWVGGVAPTAGGDPTNVLSFGDNGTRYASTNNLTGVFQLNKLVLANMSGITNVICGSNLAFTVNGATAPRLEYQTGGGAFILSNAVSLGVGMTFGGDGGGTLVVASNVTGGQPLLKQGPWTLALANSNDFANPVVVTNGGAILADNNKALGNNSIIVSDGGKLFSTPAFVFGSNAVYRSGLVTGSGSIWSNANLTISTNAVVTVENGGALMGKVSVASWGTVPYGLIVTNGGQVLAPGGGTLGGGSVTNSRILVTGPGSVFAGGATALTLGGTNNTLWADNGAVLTNLQTALIGVGNGIIVTNGSKFYTYASFQSLASGTNALTVITGTNSLLYLAGVVYIGAGGSNNEVRIENGAVSSNQAFNLSGESPGVSCRLVVNNATCYFSDDTKIGRTATMCGNQMIVTNGGQIYNLKASALTHVSYFGGSNNLLAVYTDSVYRMGPAGSPGSLRLGANGNKVLIDGGTITDLSFLIGPSGTNFANGIIVTNSGTMTLAASGSAIGNAVGCYSNWVYVGQGGKLDALGFNLQIGAAAGCWNNWLEAGPIGLITNVGTLTIGITANGTNFLRMAGGSVMANSLIATSALNTVNFSAGSLSVRSSSISNSLPFLVGDGSQTATLTLGGGTNQFIDGLVITNSATLAGNGIIQPGSTTVHGFLTPGRPGTMGALTNNGAFRLTSSSVSVFKIATNTVAGAGWDLMVVTNGNLTLGGTLKPVLVGNYQPTLTQSFVIMTNAGPLGISGDFIGGTNGAVIPAYSNDLIKVLGTFRVGISNQVVVLNAFLATSSTERGTVFKVF
jgi:fibronectin-binding autotransporter adhesin